MNKDGAMISLKHISFLLLIFFLNSCSSQEEADQEKLRKLTQKGEFIYRVHDEFLFAAAPPKPQPHEPYSWEKRTVGNSPKITKEYFRCKGSSLNPVKTYQRKEQLESFYDCSGSDKHSLPLRDGKEFIYPILVDLLNYLQSKTSKRIIITSGHRCPDHNIYCDPSPQNQFSKHMIGAEVSFYVQGLENKPEIILSHIQNYYKETAKYKDKKDFDFKRWEKMDEMNVSTPPWFNKEIFVKLFKKNEGRNFDNRHPYPYISIQVRYDLDKNEKIIYTYQQAHHNFLRK